MTFSELNIDQDMVDALATKGIIEPFPIQTQTIPLALDGQDIIGQAKTGTGKTFGFGLPIIQRLGLDPAPGVQALVVVPTRELARPGRTKTSSTPPPTGPPRSSPSTAARPTRARSSQLKAGAQIVVGTPGRLLDLAGQRLLNLSNVSEMVLDEADKMLDLGFLSDIEKLFAQTPATRHTMLFSATMPGPIVALARRFMTRPIHIRATDPDEGQIQANIKHVIYRAHSLDKDEVIARILQAEGRGKTVIFTRTKRAAAKLVEELDDRGFNAAAVHGDLNQEQRERAMAAFKAGKKDVLIATDVAARGIDVDDVTHVINHTIPDDDEDLPAPRGPHRSRGQDRHRRHVRGLGRPAQVGAHQPRPRVRPARADGDLLVVTAPLQRPRHPGGRQGPAQVDPRSQGPREPGRRASRLDRPCQPGRGPLAQPSPPHPHWGGLRRRGIGGHGDRR